MFEYGDVVHVVIKNRPYIQYDGTVYNIIKYINTILYKIKCFDGTIREFNLDTAYITTR